LNSGGAEFASDSPPLVHTIVFYVCFVPVKEGGEMLVLSRRKGETITIGENITVSVIKLEGDRVRLGIYAPNDVPILRGELERRLTAPVEDAKQVSANKSARSSKENSPLKRAGAERAESAHRTSRRAGNYPVQEL
jgi:carbon storage regulator